MSDVQLSGRLDGSIVPPRPNIYNIIIIPVRLETTQFFIHGDLIAKEINIFSSTQGEISNALTRDLSTNKTHHPKKHPSYKR